MSFKYVLRMLLLPLLGPVQGEPVAEVPSAKEDGENPGGSNKAGEKCSGSG